MKKFGSSYSREAFEPLYEHVNAEKQTALFEPNEIRDEFNCAMLGTPIASDEEKLVETAIFLCLASVCIIAYANS